MNPDTAVAPVDHAVIGQSVSAIRQVVILVGGKGTRLGHLAQATPKPLMPIGDDRVFLDYVIDGLVRQGFEHIILLAGHLSEQVTTRYAHRQIGSASIDVLVESEPLGTGGALRHAADHLADAFYLMNGDTLFDINLRALEHQLAMDENTMGCMALREVDDVGRFGAVRVTNDGMITGFREKCAESVEAGVINGGIYALRRSILSRIGAGAVSIEQDIFPSLADEGLLRGHQSSGYFLDIGLPETLEQARRELPQRKRPVLFLDRDGVLNVDHGYVSCLDRWEWIPGAKDIIREANDRGVAVVVVTNQAGVARGYYDEADVVALHWRIQRQLIASGAFIDAFQYCPDHPDASDGAYRIATPLARKPHPAMLARAARAHNLDLSRSLLVGDQPSDVAAAGQLGVPAVHFAGGNLAEAIRSSALWERVCW